MAVILSPSVRVFEDRRGISQDAACLLIDNVFRRGTVTASSEVIAQNGYFENAIDGLTFDWWEPASLPAWIEVTLPVAAPVDCGLIAVHSALTFVFQYHDGDGWVNLHDAVESGTTAVIMPIFNEVTATKFRISVTDFAEGNNAYLGVVMLGKSIRMPRPFYGGHAPITFNRKTQINPLITEGGFEKGVMTLRTGAATSVTVRHCPVNWVRDNLEQINNDLRIYPFGFAWRPFSEPDQVAYCWLNNEIRATNNGIRDLMDVNFDFEAYIGGFAVAFLPPPIEYLAFTLSESPGFLVYNANTLERIETPVIDSACAGISFALGARFLFVGTAGSGASVRCYNTDTWQTVTIPSFSGTAPDMDFYENYLAASSPPDASASNPYVVAWDGERWRGVPAEPVDKINATSAPIRYMKNGNTLIVGGGAPFIKNNALETTGYTKVSDNLDFYMSWCMDTSSNGYVAGGSIVAVFFGTSFGTAPFTETYRDAAATVSVAFNPDGDRLAAVQSYLVIYEVPVVTTPIKTFQQVGETETDTNFTLPGNSCVRYSLDGSKIYYSAQNRVTVVDANTYTRLAFDDHGFATANYNRMTVGVRSFADPDPILAPSVSVDIAVFDSEDNEVSAINFAGEYTIRPVVTILPNISDTIAQVKFYLDDVLVGTVDSAPFEFVVEFDEGDDLSTVNIKCLVSDTFGQTTEGDADYEIDYNPPWTPATIENLVVWYDASDSETVVLDGSSVNQWLDKSGNNRHATQSGTARPTYNATGFNGLPCLEFDGVNDYMPITGEPSQGSGFHVFAVVDTTSIQSDYRGVISRSGALGPSPYFGYSGGNYRPNVYAPSRQYAAQPSSVQKKAIFEFRASPTSAGTRIDGGDETTENYGTVSFSSWVGIAAAATSQAPLAKYAELSIVPLASMTTDIRQKMEGYLAHKWALQDDLPIKHPYKASPP